LQLIGVPGWHMPFVHWPGLWHGFGSMQLVPVLGVCVHPAAPHASLVHGFISSHPEGTHAPAQHMVPAPHAFVRTQVIMSAEHDASSHAFDGMQLPALQLPGTWQPWVGSHVAVPEQSELIGVCTQPVLGLQLSMVHATPSSQLCGVPPMHVPPPHVSPSVHMLPSSQRAVLLVIVQPRAGSQLAVTHGLLLAHISMPVDMQLPPFAHVPPIAHASCGSQGPVCGSWWQLPSEPQ
jgi:hypothetical protein